MKILIYSMVYSPSIGGTETATRLLAIGLKQMGHEVKIITDSQGQSPYNDGLEIHRGISAGDYLRLVSWCDVFIHSNISLRHAWPLLIHRRPWIVIHHTRDTEKTWINRLKQCATGFATNLVVSKFMADSLQAPSIVVKNPYADDVFRVEPGVTRERDLVVVGRFLEDKGFQVAIEALHLLRQRGFSKTGMTIVGDGPYHAQLDALVEKLGLQSAIEFTGIKLSEELVKIFNHHKILIVPSLTPETFGLVAVEGMASGCLVIGSDVGSLRETIGPCGLTFKAGDAKALADLVQAHLEHPEAHETYTQAAPAHLAQFERARIIPSIANCIEKAVADWKGKA
jgi:glycosyltransferase involved in cell wall biosynthesis